MFIYKYIGTSEKKKINFKLDPAFLLRARPLLISQIISILRGQNQLSCKDQTGIISVVSKLCIFKRIEFASLEAEIPFGFLTEH